MNEKLSLSNIGCKEMLLWKLTYAVSCSVLSQVLFLIIFLFIMNFNILQPVLWLQLTFSTLISLRTWLYLIPLTSIIFAQGVICSRDYVYENSYKTTRFLKFTSVFSLRNFFMVILHIITGGLIVWLYLSLLGGKYGSIYANCSEESYCLVEETFFMLINGMWVGLFYFVKNYLNSEKNLIFPVIQQSKLLTIKNSVISKLHQSMKEAIWPTMYFLVIYYYRGVKILEWVIDNSDLDLKKEGLNIFNLVNSPLLLYSWLFSTLFIFTMQCMHLFFEVFLTEQCSFPIESEFAHIMTLREALVMNNFPIIQHLACLDFYHLSIWEPIKRQQLFTLSQPGGHPHNWNRLLEEVLKLITDFSSDLNKATDAILSPEIVTSNHVTKEEKNDLLLEENYIITSPISPFSSPSQNIRSPFPTNSLRNMTLQQPEESTMNIVNVSHNKFLTDAGDLMKTVTIDKFKSLIQIAKKKTGIQYLFGEVPESRIYFLLSKGQPVIWASQGLSFLLTASYTEDSYGVVQKDLPVIVTSLVTLKQNLDKLNKVSVVNRKSLQGEPIPMQLKTALRTAVRRSLYNICNTFGDFLTQLPLSKDVHQQLQTFISYKEG